MILVAVGSNLATNAGPPLATCQAAVRELAVRGISVLAVSNWYESEPVPASDQPWFVNGVVRVATHQSPHELLRSLQDVENAFSRIRSVPNAARTLDLDLLAYNDCVLTTGNLLLPHPRFQERAFVLFPLRDVAPQWQHPVLRQSTSDLIAKAAQTLENQGIRPISLGP